MWPVLSLERTADSFGRDFGREFWGGGAATLEKQGRNSRVEKIRWKNSLRKSWAILLKFARPKLKNSPQIRSAEPWDQ